MKLLKYVFLLSGLCMAMPALIAQNRDSLLLDSLIPSGTLLQVDPSDKYYGGKKAVYLQPGITSRGLTGIDGVHMGVTLDYGHVPFNRLHWFNKFFPTQLRNMYKLHFFELAYIRHPMVAYNFRAPLISFRMAFVNKGKTNYFGLYGLLGNQLHYNKGILYYSLAISPTLQLRRFLYTFSYNPKPYLKKLDKSYSSYEEYQNDPDRLKRIEIREQHSKIQVKVSYFIQL